MRKSRILGLGLFVAMAMGTVSTASAAPFLIADFCPQNGSCPTGVTQARLTIEANTGTVDANDYFVVASFVGNASAPAFLDMLSFTITGAATPGGYTSVALQSVTGAPGVLWATWYDNVSGNVGACTSNTNASN